MPPPGSLTSSPTAARAVPDRVKRSIDRVAPRRVRPHRAPSEGLRLRFDDRGREDLPRVAQTPGEVTLVEGRAGVEAMRHRLVLDCAARGRSVMHIVGGNRLDSTGLARRAQAQGLDPGYVLRASVVARGFTAYQLSVLLEERLPAYLAEDDVAALAVVSDPLALYTDEDIRRREGRRLAKQALASIRCTADEHDVPVLIVQPPRPDRRPAPGRRDPAPGPSATRVAALLKLVRSHADQHVCVRRSGTSSGDAAARVIELPVRGERYRLAEPRSEQTRLDRFGEAARTGGSDG